MADKPSNASNEESFLSIFKKALKLVLPETGLATEADASISFGELGHIIGPMASIALQSGTAAKDGSGALNPAAIIHRAVLGEAALAAIVKMSPEAKAEFAILDKMTKIVKDSMPFVKNAWSLFGTVASSPIIHLLADALNKPNDHKESLSDPGFSSELASLLSKDTSTESAVSWESADPGYKSLMEGLVAAATADGQPTETEAWWSSIASVVVGGAVSTVGGWLSKKVKGEADFSDGAAAASAVPALDNAPLRALVGEAALQALVTVPKPALDKEGAFESMWSVFKDVLPSVIRLGGDIVNSVASGKHESLHEPIKILPFLPGQKPNSSNPRQFTTNFKDSLKSTVPIVKPSTVEAGFFNACAAAR